MMGDIYARAYGTFVWLDEVSRASQIAEIYHKSKANAEMRTREMGEAVDIADLQKLCFRELAGVKEKQDVLDFGNHSYWTRLWIIQEIFLSYRVDLVLGTRLLRLNLASYGTLLDFLGSVDAAGYSENDIDQRQIGNQTPQVKPPWTPGFFSRLALAFHGMQLESRLSLLELIEQYHDYRCEQSRDRIFGLQGIAREGAQIHVDYNINTLDLVVQCLRNQIKYQKTPDFEAEDIDLRKVRCLMEALELPDETTEMTRLLQGTSPSTRLLLTVPCFKLALYPNTLYTYPSDPIHPPSFSKLVKWEHTSWVSYRSEDYNIGSRILNELTDLTAPSPDSPQTTITYLKCCMPSADHGSS